MTARELIQRLHHLIEVAGIDPDKEITVSQYENGECTRVFELSKVVWLWDNPEDEEDYNKVLDFVIRDQSNQ